MNKTYSSPFTPLTITNQQRILTIPVYQRLFVWGEEQINLLLTDLWEASSKTVQEPYYIGIITVVENKKGWDVVDGQQRLTFLSLFGAYVLSKNFHCWNGFLYQDTNKQTEKPMRIDYIGRPEDQIDLQQIISDGELANVKNRNFRTFLNCINSYYKKI